ncbi:MAG: SMI1/KNR4 family protein [Chitinophagaceae bacterium]|nr:SMI1/KNR4 family protein [Chitinophagaceae bacterium]
MDQIIGLIKQKHKVTGIDINTPANLSDIADFERQIGFSLPTDFKAFYLTCNGFTCHKDIFSIIPLQSITQYPKDFGDNWFYFSEYMIYSDTWGLRLTATGEYEIFNGSYPNKALTSSLSEFLQKFLKGDVFETGGLYD